MQTQILLQQKGALDNRNGQIVLTAQQLLLEGKVNQAFDELRKIERRVAGHPAVVQLRRNLVAALFGHELEDNALTRMTVNGNGNGSVDGHRSLSPERKPQLEVAA